MEEEVQSNNARSVVYSWLGGIWFLFLVIAYAIQVPWAPLVFFIPAAAILGVFVYAWRKQRGHDEMGFGTLLAYVCVPVLIFYFAYHAIGATMPPKVIIVEKTQTMIVSDHSDDALIREKYVAGDFFRYFLVVLLVGAVAQAVLFLANGKVPFEVVMLVVTGVIAILLFLPNYSHADQTTITASNTLFAWGAIGTTVWFGAMNGISLVVSMLQQGADKTHPHVGLAAVIILAPVGILLTLDPGVLVMAVITNVVHNTALTMDSALVSMQQGALFGVFGMSALLSLKAVILGD